MAEEPPHFTSRTLVAQALGAVEPTTQAVVLPLHVATTFIRDPDNQYRSGYAYGRPDNATVRHTEAVIAALETPTKRLRFAPALAPQRRACLALPWAGATGASRG